jgi:prepilin-type N-terminal cleavage/methylation domain-containing protein
MSAARGRRAGFTLIETVIAMALIGLVLAKLTLVMDEAQRAHRDESVAMALEDQAMELMDRISFAIIGASRDKLEPTLGAPFHGEEISYQVSLGVEDGKVVWSDPEKIGLTPESGQVYWGQNVGQLNERKVIWANTVSEMLEDELLNGVDDNGNDLADELGLAFVIDGDSVTIRLSLERTSHAGKTIQVTKETTVTCRN